MVQGGNTTETGLGRLFLTSKLAQVGEIAVVFLIALTVILGTRPLVGENPLAFHGVVWLANVLMLLTVWRNLWITILAHGYADPLLLVQLYLAEG